MGKSDGRKKSTFCLAVEMLTHAFSRNMERASLIAGDLDFEPVVDSLIRLGTYVQMRYERSSAARDLHMAADFGQEMTLMTYYNWSVTEFIQLHPLPKGCFGDFPPSNAKIVKYGTTGSDKVDLFTDGNEFFLFAASYKDHKQLLVRFTSATFLEKYFEAVFGKIDWK